MYRIFRLSGWKMPQGTGGSAARSCLMGPEHPWASSDAGLEEP